MKVLWGLFTVKGSGSVGGHTASKNRTGDYFRTKSKPINRQSADQMSARQKFSFWSGNFRNLTETQRDAWNNATPDFKKMNSLAQAFELTGLNLYVRFNTNIQIVGGTAIDTPPLPNVVTGLDELTSLTATAGAQTISLVFATSPMPAGNSLLIFATRPMSAGRRFLKGQYRLIKVCAGGQTTPIALGTDYVAKFGAFAVGQKIGVKVVAVEDATGLESLPLNTSTIAV